MQKILRKYINLNSQKVYKSYQNLTPVQATDPRIWVYLSHTECKNYITRRWLSKHIPSDNKKQTLEINHLFLPGKNVRDKFVVNAVSRLWWFGYLANQVAPEEPELFLRVVFSQQDVAHQIITRSITSNIKLLRSIYCVMIEGWHNGLLLKRDPMRNWMKKINFFGGVILLDSLPNSIMKSKFREFAKEALLENS